MSRAASAVPFQEDSREADVPTQQPASCPQARVPSADEHSRRARRAQVSQRQGPPPPLGLIWRIRGRAAFRRLSAEGRRTRAGALWCTYVLDPSASPPRVAFALGRALGPAVVRNRLRRRLRVLLSASSLPAGLYLVGATPAAVERSFDALRTDLSRLLQSIDTPRATGGSCG